MTLTARQSRTVPQERIDPRPIDLLDFMDSCQHSPGMVEFAIPISDQLNWLRDFADYLPTLPDATRCPQKYLSLIAGNYGFELIDMPYATESERRQLVLAIPELYHRRGTLWAINRIIELLGFTATFEEYYQTTAIWNRHQFWNPSTAAESEIIYDWNDNAMQGWVNEANGHFAPAAQKLRGVGEYGLGDSSYQSCNIADVHHDCFLMVKFTVLTSGDLSLGCNIRWQDASNYMCAQLYKNASVQRLVMVECVGGSPTYIGSSNISAFDWLTGEHTLRVWDEDSKVTIILDNTTVVYQQAYTSTIQPVKKGLWVDEQTIVDFDDFALRVIDRKKQPMAFTEGIFDKELRITLVGSPAYASAKAEYLEKIIPNFTPLDTTVVWV